MQLEILALRHQLIVLQRKKKKRPRLRQWDRMFWVWLSDVWGGWQNALVIVKPSTVVKWHRNGFKAYWRRKSRQKEKIGRKPVSKEVRDLIKRICKENPLWGAPRIHGELMKLGYDLVESTVAKYMVKPEKPPSQTWKTFLENHMGSTVAMDFFTAPTIFFNIIHVLILLDHERRRIIHFNVTINPNRCMGSSAD
jgi:putative transposase